jgi:glycosyltransferase involved in cell wall biosynthesis
LATAIRRLLSDEQLRARLGREAARVVDRFSSERYYAQWDAVLDKKPPENVA